MYSIDPFTGSGLPSKVLCLTYDDGPGKDTYDIAKFLHDENIQATFFVVGKYAFHHQDILEKIATMGHLVGNHTYDHPDMTYSLSVNGDVNNQVLRTDTIIKKYVNGNTVYFRSPYGKWSPEVAGELNLNILSAVNHIGPVHWDIDGADCHYWKNDYSVDEVVTKYMEDIEAKDHGIVVMHDDIADMNYLKSRNRTAELTKQLIPKLKQQGYQFVRLDEIESIKKDAARFFKFTLKSTSGFVCLAGIENNTIRVDGKQNSLNPLSMEDLGHGTIALKAANGLFFSVQAAKKDVVEAISLEVKESETFDLITLSSNEVALRAYNGNYLAKEHKHGGRLFATAPYLRGCERFSFSPVDMQAKKNMTLSDRYKNLKRQILYIRSKIRQGNY